ncbi:MAG: DUF302 domain-containing protein [Myxococcota bacterium]
MDTTYGFGRDLDAPVEDAVARITAALKEQGFGILTRIDAHRVLAEKIGADIPPYVILGACNPKLAHQAITNEGQVGLLLPCNVLVQANPSGGSTVSIADPRTMGQISGNPALQPLMADAEARLRAALAAA